MKHIATTLVATVFVSGCLIREAPENNVGFERISSLNDLAGTYRNQAEPGREKPPVYLSSVIWGKIHGIEHEAVREVEVRTLNENTLVVRAIGDEGVEYESEFVEGLDFKIESGRIELLDKVGVEGHERGSVVIGPYHEIHSLGIDKRGDGKLLQKVEFVGLVFALGSV